MNTIQVLTCALLLNEGAQCFLEAGCAAAFQLFACALQFHKGDRYFLQAGSAAAEGSCGLIAIGAKTVAFISLHSSTST